MTTRSGQPAPAPLPGAVGVSRLRVYDTPTPDGLVGGSAHVHLACMEGYLVVAGRGVVQTLGAGGFQETELSPGRLVWFTPGLIHRLVNHGGLEIVTIMQNAGLPEAGDAVLTFPPEVLADPARYQEAASLAPREGGPTPLELAWRRRDLAVQGFTRLREQVEREGPGALKEFYEQAARLVQGKVSSWRALWEATALRLVTETGEHLDALARGDHEHLLRASLQALPGPVETGRLGMCGTLDTYLS